MAGSASALAFKSDFDAFLMAMIGADGNDGGMQLSVLSALARLGVDPWEEAAALSRLPSEPATRKLTSLIAALPNWPSMRLDAGTIAARLIPLLPQRAESNVQPRVTSSDADSAGESRRINVVMIYVICMVLVLVAQWFVANPAAVSQSDKPSAPIRSTVSSPTPPQTSGQ